MQKDKRREKKKKRGEKNGKIYQMKQQIKGELGKQENIRSKWRKEKEEKLLLRSRKKDMLEKRKSTRQDKNKEQLMLKKEGREWSARGKNKRLVRRGEEK